MKVVCLLLAHHSSSTLYANLTRAMAYAACEDEVTLLIESRCLEKLTTNGGELARELLGVIAKWELYDFVAAYTEAPSASQASLKVLSWQGWRKGLIEASQVVS